MRCWRIRTCRFSSSTSTLAARAAEPHGATNSAVATTITNARCPMVIPPPPRTSLGIRTEHSGAQLPRDVADRLLRADAVAGLVQARRERGDRELSRHDGDDAAADARLRRQPAIEGPAPR